MSMEIFESSSFETLWEQFEKQISSPLTRPLATDEVVVPASGWESYIKRRLTDSRGCWAQFNFATLGGWVNRSLSQWLPGGIAASRDSDTFAWTIASQLPQLIDDPDFDSVRRYLKSDGDAAETRRLIDLSRQIGGLFDQYTLYRPELLDAWNAGNDWTSDRQSPKHARWQRKLWRAIGGIGSSQSVAALIDQMSAVMQSKMPPLPERVNVWICGGLPPVHLQFLNAIGEATQIYLYVLSPSYTCWGTPDEQMEQIRKWIDSGDSMRSFCQNNGLTELHPLVNSLGQLSRHRIRLMKKLQTAVWQTNEPSLNPDLTDETTLLGRLQRDLFEGSVPTQGPVPTDNSLRIHNCHSPIREVEVLQDEIRDALENDQQLRPEDIVVLCPDLETYAPFIDAAFGLTRPGQEGNIPYHIAGRSPRRTRPIISAYFRVLDVLQGRFGAAVVLDLLNDELIASAIGLTADDVADIFSWISDSGVRWGLDASHRTSESLPDTDLNTWEFGLDRLLMGYAMPPGGGQLVGSIVALDRVQGLDGERLGKCWAFIRRLREWREEIARPRTIGQWRKPLCSMADLFVDTTEDEAGAQKIRFAIDRLVSVIEQNGFEQPLTFAIVANELAHETDQMTGGAAFQLGCMTVCEMAARRSIPYKIVALLGMNAGAFPRVDRHVGFDLLPSEPRLGDRSLRLEDKHLFLEALMSARHRLVITYQGQNVRNLRTRPPSVVVEELLDAIERGCDETTSPDTIRDQIIVRHPLQSFSHRNFDSADSRLFSYDQSEFRAAKAIWKGAGSIPIFASAPLPEPEHKEEINVSDLRRFINRPWEVFLRRLGLYLGEPSEVGDDREPLMLDALQNWGLGNWWLNQRLANEHEDKLVDILIRGGQLPAGGLGRQLLSKLQREAEEVVEAAREQGVDVTEAKAVRVVVDNTMIVGRINGLTPQGLRVASFSKAKSKQVMRLWLDHLLLTASEGRSIGSAISIGRPDNSGGDRIELRAISPPAAIGELEKLLKWYRLSLRYPLPLFPNAIGSVVSAIFKGDDIEDEQSARRLLYAADSEYSEQRVGTAESTLFSVRTAFAGHDPMKMTCVELPELESGGDLTLFHCFVRSICLPMVDHLECLVQPRAGT
jgi:exodeoxyribonuclease V gamma subunit